MENMCDGEGKHAKDAVDRMKLHERNIKSQVRYVVLNLADDFKSRGKKQVDT